MLLNISFPHAPFNAAIKDGTASQKLGRIIDETKPEAIYFHSLPTGTQSGSCDPVLKRVCG